MTAVAGATGLRPRGAELQRHGRRKASPAAPGRSFSLTYTTISSRRRSSWWQETLFARPQVVRDWCQSGRRKRCSPRWTITVLQPPSSRSRTRASGSDAKDVCTHEAPLAASAANTYLSAEAALGSRIHATVACSHLLSVNWRTSEPSERMAKIWPYGWGTASYCAISSLNPMRPLLNTIQSPSEHQAACALSPGTFVRRRSSVPFGRMVYSSNLPSRLLVNKMRSAVGDHWESCCSECRRSAVRSCDRQRT
jgi:hypothetical protein